MSLSRPEQLARLLRISLRELYAVLRHADEFYEELLLLDPRNPGRQRHVVNPRGAVRRLQSRFYTRVLAPNLDRSPHSHGGIPGRNVLTNVTPHLGQAFLFTTDIASFYPSIRRERVFKLFLSLGCSNEIARLCTRLSTYQHRLEQGLVTSPILW